MPDHVIHEPPPKPSTPGGSGLAASDTTNDDADDEVVWIEDGGPSSPESSDAEKKKITCVLNNNTLDDDDEEDDEEYLGSDMFGADSEPYGDFVLRLGSDSIVPSSSGENDDELAVDDDASDDGGAPNSPVTKHHRKQLRLLLPPITVTVRGKKPSMPQFLTSTGLTLWEGSRVLAEYLYDNVDVWASEAILTTGSSSSSSTNSRQETSAFVVSVVELGAGLGVCGIIAYRILTTMMLQRRRQRQNQPQVGEIVDDDDSNKNDKSSRSTVLLPPNLVPYVVLTDGDTATLRNMRENVTLNRDKVDDDDNDATSSRSTPGQGLPHRKPYISCKQLLWGAEFVDPFLLKYGPPPSTPPSSGPTDMTTTSTTSSCDSIDPSLNNNPSNDVIERGSNKAINKEGFGVVMAADVVYGIENLVPLMETALGLLRKCESAEVDDFDVIRRRSGGIFILSYVFRTVPIKQVIQCAYDHGLVCIEQPKCQSTPEWFDTSVDTSQKAAENNNMNGVYIFRHLS